jgi:hypothetical protein
MAVAQLDGVLDYPSKSMGNLRDCMILTAAPAAWREVSGEQLEPLQVQCVNCG